MEDRKTKDMHTYIVMKERETIYVQARGPLNPRSNAHNSHAHTRLYIHTCMHIYTHYLQAVLAAHDELAGQEGIRRGNSFLFANSITLRIDTNAAAMGISLRGEGSPRRLVIARVAAESAAEKAGEWTCLQQWIVIALHTDMRCMHVDDFSPPSKWHFSVINSTLTHKGLMLGMSFWRSTEP